MSQQSVFDIVIVLLTLVYVGVFVFASKAKRSNRIAMIYMRFGLVMCVVGLLLSLDQPIMGLYASTGAIFLVVGFVMFAAQKSVIAQQQSGGLQ